MPGIVDPTPMIEAQLAALAAAHRTRLVELAEAGAERDEVRAAKRDYRRARRDIRRQGRVAKW